MEALVIQVGLGIVGLYALGLTILGIAAFNMWAETTRLHACLARFFGVN